MKNRLLVQFNKSLQGGNISGNPVGEHLHCRLHDASFKFKYGDLLSVASMICLKTAQDVFISGEVTEGFKSEGKYSPKK